MKFQLSMPLLIAALLAVLGMTLGGLPAGYLCQCHGEAMFTSESECASGHTHQKSWETTPHDHEPHEPCESEPALVSSDALKIPSWFPKLTAWIALTAWRQDDWGSPTYPIVTKRAWEPPPELASASLTQQVKCVVLQL